MSHGHAFSQGACGILARGLIISEYEVQFLLSVLKTWEHYESMKTARYQGYPKYSDQAGDLGRQIDATMELSGSGSKDFSYQARSTKVRLSTAY